MQSRIILVSLARNQTAFYLGVAEALRRRGHPVTFLSFHEPSIRRVRAQGFEAWSGFEASSRFRFGQEADAAQVLERFNIENPNRWISHEKVCYEIRDGRALVRKLAAYLEGIDSLFRRIRAEDGTETSPPVLVQELGGFLSVVAGFFAARSNEIRNVFIEPSFFRGRVFFVANSFQAPKLLSNGSATPDPAMIQYLRDTVRDKKIVIPSKDRGSYRSSLAKILSPRNVARLVQKVSEKYLRGEREEFSHLGGHVSRHLRMARNQFLFHRYYRNLPPGARYVYYPLHVPHDVSLTIRAPEYLDQYALIDCIARNVPLGHRLLLKEHPATVGAADYDRMTSVLRQHDHVSLLHPGLNNYDVIGGADAVVTVNSKSGAEALLLGKPVLALGDSFYRDSGLVHPVQSLTELSQALAQGVRSAPPDPGRVEEFFQRVWDQSYPGELYAEDTGNTELFAQSLIHFLSVRG